MSGEGKKSVGSQVAKGGLYGILLLLGAFVLLLFLSAAPYLIQMGYHFLCGWVIHAWKALPHFFSLWQGAVLPVGCLLMAAVIGHRFIRRWVDEKFPDRTWRATHTAGVLSLLLLGSAAAIALSGVVHQMFWLAGGKVIESNRRADLTEAISNGRQLMLAIYEYQDKNGRYPASFEELVPDILENTGHLRWLSWSSGRGDRVPEPWILLRPSFSGETIVPVIVSPIVWSREKPMVVVGYSDATMKSIRVEDLAKLLSESGLTESGGRR